MELQGGYIRSFDTVSEFNEERNSNYYEPWVSYTQSNSALTYNKTEEEKLLEPLTFEVIGDGNIEWGALDSAYTCTIEYKKNNGEWTSITSNVGTSAPSINAVSGDVIQFRGDNATCSFGIKRYNTFSYTTCQFKVKGNIMSLVNSTDFATATTLASSYTFYYLFWNCTGLTSAENLILPATTLASSCYENMFASCTSLTTAPKLPATTLVYGCYTRMFASCTSLTTAPKLPATSLAMYCYQDMFRGCTSLTTAPELPATTLTSGCYWNMFNGCTSLTTAPELPATTLAEYCYAGMFSGCTSLTTAPSILPATTLIGTCYESMFRSCSSLTTAPELPATTLTTYCYRYMFQNCNNLNYIKAMFTTIPSNNYTDQWVSGVASTGTFVKNSAATWNVTGVNGIPTGWTVQYAN